MSTAVRTTLSITKRPAQQTSTSTSAPAASVVRSPGDKDSARLVYKRNQLDAMRSPQTKLSRELEQCQQRIAECEGKGVDSSVMPQRRMQRELRDKLTIIGKKIERQTDALVSAQKYQDDWYAMRARAHRAWGFAIAQDYLADGRRRRGLADPEAAREGWRSEIDIDKEPMGLDSHCEVDLQRHGIHVHGQPESKMECPIIWRGTPPEDVASRGDGAVMRWIDEQLDAYEPSLSP